MSRTEIIFEMTEDEADGGFSATALGYGIQTQGESVDEILCNIRSALDGYFGETMERPGLVHLHFVRDENPAE